MTIERIDHQDGATTFASPLHEITIPAARKPGGPEPSQDELDRRERMRIVQIQARSIPEDGNIGPSRHGGPTSFAGFRRRLVQDTLRSLSRNLCALRELDDDPRLGRLAVDIAEWEEELRET